jgi:D-glycero-alpha-D-manno-heptose-7-phosphate kinase
MRICDIGGWTDTWFSGHGKVLNIGVTPLLEVQVDVHPADGRRSRVVIDARSFGERYAVDPRDPPGRQPLLEAVVSEMGVPEDWSVDITVHSQAPAGCATGTSAATAVALIGALDALTPGRMTPLEIAAVAHRVEVDRLGLESGVQDQLCAALGGVTLIDIHDYPQASVQQLRATDAVWSDLEQRLLLVYLGQAHVSSEVHEQVIARVGADGAMSTELEQLRNAAQDAWDALCAADLQAFGQSMVDNTAAQRALHPDLISRNAEELIDRAAAHGALGWKVNGAGGEGGSLTILCDADQSARHALLGELRAIAEGCREIPIELNRGGLRVWVE